MQKINAAIAKSGLEPIKKRFFAKFKRLDENSCWVWFGARTPKNYGYLMVSRQTAPIVLIASRLSWFIHCGPIPEGKFVLHKCDNPPCVNPNHLFIGTKQDNATDALTKGRLHCPKGSEHALSKLTEESVKTIRTLRKEGMTLQAIADQFGVTKGCIHHIDIGFTWKHVTP